MKVLGSDLALRNDLCAASSTQLQALPVLSNSGRVAYLPGGLKFNGAVAHGVNGRVVVVA